MVMNRVHNTLIVVAQCYSSEALLLGRSKGRKCTFYNSLSCKYLGISGAITFCVYGIIS